MKKYISIAFLLFFSVMSIGQELSNYREKIILISTDTVCLDSLSIFPESLIVKDLHENSIPESQYSFDFVKALLILSDTLLNRTDSLLISYRVMSIDLSKRYYHKNLDLIKASSGNMYAGYQYIDDKQYMFKNQGLNKSGSISRGISFGNQQDAVLNSNLNLQLSGKLNNDLNILASISDANIPIQPDGNSQQIQEFDKVFIKIYNEKIELIAGDFEIASPEGYFLKLNKKAKGATFTYSGQAKENKYAIKTTLSGAVSKGKYCRKQLKTNEGNQGPYRLQGCDNESYIIVLSGSEKIYIDGKLVVRGQDNDYIINYNTAEITFTANQLISKDKRIVVEFEYTEQNYVRFLAYNSTEFRKENQRFYINIYNENDNKNQSLEFDLSKEQKLFLSNVGDNTEEAFYPNIFEDTIYSQNYIYYELTDTVVSYESGQLIYYDSLYRYSTNPETAKYRMGFSFVGANNGNYELTSTNANGKVYEWVAPDEDGILQGTFEPVVLLITPKKKQIISLGGETIFDNAVTNYEIALSNTDLNTYSNKDKKDDLGYAMKFNFYNIKKPKKQTSFNYALRYELTNKNFSPVERFRSTEFERDWNIDNAEKSFNQHTAGFTGDLKIKKNIKASYDLSMVNLQNEYNAVKNGLLINYNKSGNRVYYSGSYLNSYTSHNKTTFYRHVSIIEKSLKWFSLGLHNEMENNSWKNAENDSLLGNSFSYNQWEVVLKNLDSLPAGFFAGYKTRKDYLPFLNNNMLINSSKADDFNIGFELKRNPQKSFKSTLSYRNLSISDTSITTQRKDQTLLGRIESNLRFFKGSLHSSSLYEIGSGLESVKEYSFVEVENGLGIYIWNDYNKNDIQELEEFEIASYRDTANYIRIQLPGSYVKVYTTNFSQVLNLKPGRTWYKEEGIKKALSRFSNQFAYRVNSKSAQENIIENINPFKLSIDNNEIVSLSYSLKNTISFNRTHPVFGLDYTLLRNTRKDLLLAGYNTRENITNNIRLRWNINKKLSLSDNAENGNSIFSSEAYSTKNYNISYLKNEIAISIQPSLIFRIMFSYKYNSKLSQTDENSVENNIGANIKYKPQKKGNFTAQINYFQLKFNGETNSPLAYQMLEGFLPGNNLTWSVQYQQQIAGSLQLSLQYNGRKLPDTEVLNTGGIQLRAFF